MHICISLRPQLQGISSFSTYVIEFTSEGSVRLQQLEEGLQPFRLVGQHRLRIGQTVLSTKHILMGLISADVIASGFCRLSDAHALIEVTRLVYVAIQNARVQFAACIVHCNERERERGNE